MLSRKKIMIASLVVALVLVVFVAIVTYMFFSNPTSNEKKPYSMSLKDGENSFTMAPGDSQIVTVKFEKDSKLEDKVHVWVSDVGTNSDGSDKVNKISDERVNRSMWVSGYNGIVDLDSKSEHVYNIHIPKDTPTGIYKIGIVSSLEKDLDLEASKENSIVLELNVDSKISRKVSEIYVKSVKQDKNAIELEVWNGGTSTEEPRLKTRVYMIDTELPFVEIESEVGTVNEHSKKFLRFEMPDAVKSGKYVLDFEINLDGKKSVNSLPLTWKAE